VAQAGEKKKAATSSRASSRTTKKIPEKQEVEVGKAPRRREILAIVCFALGIFSFIGYFDAEPVFISFLTGFVMRLIGHGFFAIGPALIMCSVILMFHKGRPILLRTVCTLVLPVFIGAMVHLFTNTVEYEFSFAMFPDLWSAGAALQSGGVISGTIAELFMWLFGNVGTAITLILGTGILVFVAFKTTIVRIVETYKNRSRLEYIPQPEPPQPQDYPQIAEDSVAPPHLHSSVNKKQYRHAITPAWKKRKIDIPVDEDGVPLRDHFEDDNDDVSDRGYFKRKPEKADSGESAGEEHCIDGAKADDPAGMDMPIDIPFMEGKMRRPPPVVPPIMRERFMSSDESLSGFSLQDESAFESSVEPETSPESASKPERNKKSSSKEKPAPEDFSPINLPAGSYAFPPLSLLSKGDPKSRAGDSEVKQNIERLETAFTSFGVNVKISNATRGPSVTRYEAALEAGVKLSKLTNLADDIALSLGTVGVRIAAMPNRISTVGIEVPNKEISKVHLRDVLQSDEFSKASSKLSFTIGMDITGDPIIGDISKLPHMLVAGTTGSGKSVCLNSIILSILYKASPEDVRFIMVDPKMVEFKVYNDIPHLLVPVVTDAKKAAGALQWATFEMMKRYKLFSETNARDLAGYNEIARSSDDEERVPLPQVVVVIDELADLMMLAAKEVEESICRVAQMGRASGIHLIIATQSPRADVITGLMKANIPSRIAFKVSSALESRIILDSGSSADKLVGYGDMLYAPTGAAKPMRLQGTWVSDSEREVVIDYIKGSGQTQYSEEVMGEIEKVMVEKSSGEKSSADTAGSGDDYDDLLPQAVDVILETGQASVSLLQRRLKLGYSRAARIVDQMEELGVVGPFEGSKPRSLLVTRDEWRQMQYVSGVAPTDRGDLPEVSSVSEE